MSQSNAVATKNETPLVSPAVDGIASAIQALITRPDLDVSKVRELFELQREVRRDEAFAAFNDAMNAAQEEMEPVRKDANNPQTRSKYASYAALDSAIRPIYTKHGFSVSFNTADCPKENEVRTVAEVARGGFSKFYHLDIPADGKGAKGGDVMTKTHATMSAVSYGKRGLLQMIWNISTADKTDDDGNAAGNTGAYLSEDQIAELRQLIIEVDADLPKLLAYLKIERLEDIYASKFEVVKRVIEQKRKKAAD